MRGIDKNYKYRKNQKNDIRQGNLITGKYELKKETFREYIMYIIRKYVLLVGN